MTIKAEFGQEQTSKFLPESRPMRATTLLLLFSLFTQAFGFETVNWDLAIPYKRKCEEGGKGQRADNACLQAAYEAVDTKLNDLYKRLHAALLDPQPLLASQRAWLKFRDSQCNFLVGKDNGGDEYSYSMNACLIDLTEKRALDLQSIYPCNGCVEFKKEFYKPGKWPYGPWQ